MPTNGKFNSSSIQLPIQKDAITPQKRLLSVDIIPGPGFMPCIINVANIKAITGVIGMPKLNMGMKLVCAPALLAASGPATPAIAPRPNS